jgi:thiol:disulfide interchange protein DsbD
VGGVGPKGAFGLGLVCGLIAAPCTGPVLTGILTWIAKTQSAGAGALAMAAFSLGLGFPFLIVGTFAVQLPKSGVWMVHVKSVLAIVLSVVALYYLGTAFPALSSWVKPSAVLFGVAGAATLVGLVIGGVHRSFDSPEMKDKVLKGAGTALSTLGLYVLLIALITPERELDWTKVSVQAAAATAKSEERPMLVDFTATWCGACKELDKLTFADPAVSREAGRFVAVKVDATDDEDPVVAQTMESLKVVGLPTVLLFDSQGKEVRRFTDFVDAKNFLTALRSVR